MWFEAKAVVRTTDHTGIKSLVKKFYKQFYDHKLHRLDDKNKFLERHTC